MKDLQDPAVPGDPSSGRDPVGLCWAAFDGDHVRVITGILVIVVGVDLLSLRSNFG